MLMADSVEAKWSATDRPTADQNVKAGVIVALPKTHEALPDELKLLRAGARLQLINYSELRINLGSI